MINYYTRKKDHMNKDKIILQTPQICSDKVKIFAVATYYYARFSYHYSRFFTGRTIKYRLYQLSMTYLQATYILVIFDTAIVLKC